MIQDKLRDILSKALADLTIDYSEEIEIETTAQLSFGDFATNIAMKIAKQEGKNPRELAEAIVMKISSPDVFTQVVVAGPGFINMTLAPDAWKVVLSDVLSKDGRYGSASAGKTLVVDYGGENIAKPMSIGHLRSNVIGQACVNIYRFLGWKVIGDNHLGDWGTQFGKLIVAYKKWGEKAAVEKQPIPELVKLYQRFHDEAETHPELVDEGRKAFKELEEGNTEYRDLWKWFIEESLKEFSDIHAQLGVSFDTMNGESFYEDMLQDLIAQALDSGVATKNDDGSVAVEFDDLPSFLIQKSDGATIYTTRDMAAIKHRLDTYKPDAIVYFVDKRQELHFNQLFTVCNRMGLKGTFFHAWFGAVTLEGEAMSTRAGHVVYLRDLISKTTAKALELVNEKGLDLTPEEAEEVARQIGIGSIIYNDLSQNRQSDINFSWDEALRFDGNHAPYLQYTHARAMRLLGKAEEELGSFSYAFDMDHEREILRHLAMFPTAVSRAAEEFFPHLISNNLYGLCQAYNHFYNSAPILQAEADERQARLHLTKAVALTLKTGLELLGISAPNKM